MTLPKPMTSGAKLDGRFGKQDLTHFLIKSACRRWQISLYFCEIIRRWIPTGLEKKSRSVPALRSRWRKGRELFCSNFARNRAQLKL